MTGRRLAVGHINWHHNKCLNLPFENFEWIQNFFFRAYGHASRYRYKYFVFTLHMCIQRYIHTCHIQISKQLLLISFVSEKSDHMGKRTKNAFQVKVYQKDDCSSIITNCLFINIISIKRFVLCLKIGLSFDNNLFIRAKFLIGELFFFWDLRTTNSRWE